MLNLIWISIKMNLLEMWSYKLNSFLEILVSFIWGASIVLGLNAIGLKGSNFYLAYIAWTFFHYTANRVGLKMDYMTTIGVIERIFSSHYPVKWLILSITSLSTIMAFIYLTFFYVVGYLAGIIKSFHYIETIGVFGIIFLFMVGLSYLFAGLFLIFKRTMSLVQVVNLLLFGIGAYAAGANKSLWTKFLTYTYGIETIVKIHSGGHISSGNIGILLLSAIVMIVIGALFFDLSYSYARKAGTIGHL